MSNIDDLFRDGLGERKPDVPADLWRKIAASKTPVGEQLDRLFADGLGERQAPVPAGMWARIVAARRPVGYWNYALALLLLLITAGSLTWYWNAESTGAGPQVQSALEAGDEASTAAAESERRELDGAATGGERSEGKWAATGTERPEVEWATPAQRSEVFADRVRVSSEAVVSNSPDRVFDARREGEAIGSEGITAVKSIASLPISPLTIHDSHPEAGPIELTAERTFRRSHHHRLQGEILLGAAYANQSFGLQREGSQRLRDLREVSEFPEISFQITARVRYRLRGHLHLLTGLTYTELRNRIEYDRMLPTGAELVRSSNRIRMLEVPLLASLELPGRRLRLNLNAGPVINLTTGVSGIYLDPNSVTPLDLRDSGHYRRGVGIGWTASLTTSYPIGKQRTTQLLLEPFFKHYPQSFTTTEAPLSERYWVAGLQLGLRRTF